MYNNSQLQQGFRWNCFIIFAKCEWLITALQLHYVARFNFLRPRSMIVLIPSTASRWIHYWSKKHEIYAVSDGHLYELF